jgi:hypothetical protein
LLEEHVAVEILLRLGIERPVHEGGLIRHLVQRQPPPARERIDQADHRRLEQERHGTQMLGDRPHLVGRQEEQGPVAERPKVDLVVEPIEPVRLGRDLGGELLEHRLHLGAIGPLDSDDEIVIGAELLDELLPALVVILRLADEIVAVGQVREAVVRVGDGEDAAQDDAGDDQPGVSAAEARERDQRPGEEAFGFVRVVGIVSHGRVPPCTGIDGSSPR